MRITGVESFILHAPIPRQVNDSFNEALMWGLPSVVVRTVPDTPGASTALDKAMFERFQLRHGDVRAIPGRMTRDDHIGRGRGTRPTATLLFAAGI